MTISNPASIAYFLVLSSTNPENAIIKGIMYMSSIMFLTEMATDFELFFFELS